MEFEKHGSENGSWLRKRMKHLKALRRPMMVGTGFGWMVGGTYIPRVGMVHQRHRGGNSGAVHHVRTDENRRGDAAAMTQPAAQLDTARDIIICRDVHKWYDGYHAVRGVTTTVRRGQVVVIVGPSGSGKSTFLRTINRNCSDLVR